MMSRKLNLPCIMARVEGNPSYNQLIIYLFLIFNLKNTKNWLIIYLFFILNLKNNGSSEPLLQKKFWNMASRKKCLRPSQWGFVNKSPKTRILRFSKKIGAQKQKRAPQQGLHTWMGYTIDSFRSFMPTAFGNKHGNRIWDANGRYHLYNLLH